MARPKKNNKKDKMTISFTEFDEDVYDFLAKNRNASALVRFLVRSYMHKKDYNNTNDEFEVDFVNQLESNVSEPINKEPIPAPEEQKEVAIPRVPRGSGVSSKSVNALKNAELNY